MKQEESIPDDIRRFVLTSIPSVAFIEALLLLHAEPARPWDAQRLAARLYISDDSAAQLLAALSRAHFVTEEAAEAGGARFRYDAGSAKHQEMMDRLADSYARNLVEITRLIHSTLERKAQMFAEAFKWHKDS